MSNINILVFPCGSEIALEIYRSLRYSRIINLFGANSIDDHGKFVFENYTGGLPFVNHPSFIEELKYLIRKLDIDIIYPAMDSVITVLKENEALLECKVIASPAGVTQICLSKTLTYNKLADVVRTPLLYQNASEVRNFPVFMKPVIGYGSRGARKINSPEEINLHLKDYPDSLIMEYLPGEEYTVDCFTDKNGNLLFCGGRIRNRIMNGISVNTTPVSEKKIRDIAVKINNSLPFRGAWFFQLRKDINGELVLLEIASRLGGSSSLYRNKGINFALLSVFDCLDEKVEIIENEYPIELDRALDNKYKIDLEYEHVYIDFDDCLILNGKVNDLLVRFIYQAINKGKKIILLTKHGGNIHEALKEYRLGSIFDEIIHIRKEDDKCKYISSVYSIFIDDSFLERKEVYLNKKIPVFSPDMVESLLE